MKFNGKYVSLFLAVVAGVESFTSTTFTTNTRSISFDTTNKKVCAPKKQVIGGTFGLSSLASTEESSVEATEETSSEESAVVETETTEVVVSEDEESESGSTGEDTPIKTEGEVEDITKIAYVVNLSYDTQGYQLKELFNEHGKVQKVFMPKQRGSGRPKGIAFVTMESEEERDLAIEKLNETDVDGRTVYVAKAKPRSEKKAGDRVNDDSLNKKLYVGNISYDTTREDLMEFFSEYGSVLDVYVPVDRESGLPRGFAFVTMANDNADKAIENASGTSLQGRTIEVKESLPKGTKAPAREKREPTDNIKIYIGNMSFDTEEDTLRSLFEEFGELVDLYIPTDRYSGRPRGFAFVTMHKDNVASAIEGCDGLEVDGRILRVNEAQPKGYSTPKYDEWSEEGDWGEEE